MITETNYCAHAIDDMRYFSGLNEDIADAAKLFLSVISETQKFRLPEAGRILDWAGKNFAETIVKYASPFRLPYQAVAIEFTNTTKHKGHEVNDVDASIVIAREMDIGGEIVICIISASRSKFDDVDKMWFPSRVMPIIRSDGSYQLKRLWDHEGPDESLDIDDYEFKENLTEMESVIQLIAACSCQNVSTRLVAPNAALNKKRCACGKQPFFSYHVLEIAGPANPGQSLGGTHASPRIHLRRGHIRRLTDKTVWVNACVVGNKALGMVTKDYRVKAAPQTAPSPASDL